MHGPPASPPGAGQRHRPTECEESQQPQTAVLQVTLPVWLLMIIFVQVTAHASDTALCLLRCSMS